MNNKLFEFIRRAGKSTYAGDGKRESDPERPGFREYVYSEGDLIYRDSYTGYVRSSGLELVRKRYKPVWTSLYYGGMVKGKESLADAVFEFLKRAMSTDEPGFKSFRGPHSLIEGDWEYKYEQEGDIGEFQGYEEIYHKSKLVFFHRIMGGKLVG